MWFKAQLTAFFFVKMVSVEGKDVHFLLEDKTTGNVVEWTSSKNMYEQGSTYRLKIDGECSRVFVVDDEFNIKATPLICSATSVEAIND